MPDFKDFSDYFNQGELYWSESNGNFIRLDEMPFQQAFFSHRKLIREHGLEAYGGTHLYQAFIRLLVPSPAQIREQFSRYGKACATICEPGPWGPKTVEQKVRKKLRDAGRPLSYTVKTRKVKTAVGSYLEATVSVTGIKIKGRSV